MAPVFHEDELKAQCLAGGGVSGTGIRSFLPDQHREFFSRLPYLFVATADSNGWPLATILIGQRGFVVAPGQTHLCVAALPAPEDPAAPYFNRGQSIGVLGLDLATRRRNRANGIIADRTSHGFVLQVQQSFGNCAKYIQCREVELLTRAPDDIEQFDSLDESLLALITTADTFFVASCARADIHAHGGMDISHRGGKPGFIHVSGDQLSIPDFRGNRYYNTLGNLLGQPRASLLFLDFKKGDVVQLQGEVKIDWLAETNKVDAERFWHFHFVRGWRRRSALSLLWSPQSANRA